MSVRRPFGSRLNEITRLAAWLLVALMATGCAHPLVINPDMSKIEVSGARQIPKNIGYFISEANKGLAVVTPGGGGDSVTYYPYKDMEPGLYKMLSSVFKTVTVLKDTRDADAIKAHGITYIITPTITADSSSPSPLTWPPTRFTVNLTANISDSTGAPVISLAVTGTGSAEYPEFMLDPALASNRAALDALNKMRDALLSSAQLTGR